MNYQLSSFILKLRDADTTLMYKSPLTVFVTAVQPVPVLVIPCGPAVILKLEATPDHEPICKVPDDLVNLIQSPDTAVNSIPLAAVFVKFVLLQVVPPAVLLVAELDATELATLDATELATLDATELATEELAAPPTKP